MPVSFESLAIAAAIIACGYFVFGLSGFGSALVTVPVLSHLWPVQFVVPVLAMLDIVAAMFVGMHRRAQPERGELVRLIPLAFVGAVLGVSLLVNLPRTASLVSLGMFVALYGVYALIGPRPSRPVSRKWAYVAGFTGGAVGTLFGIAGPAYVMYLSRRLSDKTTFRATLSTMVFFSVSGRLLIFAVAGLLLWAELQVALFLLPFAFLGLWAGGRVHLSISPARLGRVISMMLIASGASLVLRALTA